MERLHQGIHDSSPLPNSGSITGSERGDGPVDRFDAEYSLTDHVLGGLGDYRLFLTDVGDNSQEGSEKKINDMEWDLFEQDPEQWFRKRHPDWDDERVKYEVENVERLRLVERYDELRKEVREKHPDLFRRLFE